MSRTVLLFPTSNSDDVFSNVFGKSASAIISFMLEHPGETFDVAPFMITFVKGRIHKKIKSLKPDFSTEFQT